MGGCGMDCMLREIESLRAQVAALTEEKARTDAAVDDHLAYMARVTEERDTAKREEDAAVNHAIDLVNQRTDLRDEAHTLKSEVTRLRAALVHLSASVASAVKWLGCAGSLDHDREDPENPGFLDELCRDDECVRCDLDAAHKTAALAPEGKASDE